MNLTPEEQQRILEAADRIITLAPLSAADLIDHLIIVAALSSQGVQPENIVGAAIQRNPIILSHLVSAFGADGLADMVVSKGQLYPPRIEDVGLTREAIRQKMKEWGIE